MRNKIAIAVSFLMILFVFSGLAECTYFDSYGDHDWINGETVSSCETDGSVYRDCSICGLREVVNTTAATGHIWIEGGTPADCTTAGESYRDCSICGKHEVIETTEALGHSWTEIITAPTCVSDGVTVKECSICGASETVASEPAIGHDWADGKTEPICDNPGEIFRVCTICEEYQTIEIIEALTHDWLDKELIAEADCENDGSMRKYCSICEEERVFILPSSGHSYSEWETVKSATCTDEGEKTRYCHDCGKEVTEYIEREEHDYGDWIITEEATDSSKGQRYHRCTECGASAEEWYYPEGTLYRGMYKNDDVLKMQEKLTVLGFLDDKADGIFGKKTEQAVIEFQKTAELEESGVAYPQTLEAIETAAENEVLTEGESSIEKCEIIISDGGVIEIAYCSRHNQLITETDVMLSEYDGDEDALNEIYDIWHNEMTALYETCIESTEETVIILITESHESFIEYLTSIKALWESVYFDTPETVTAYAIDLIKAYCANVCGMIK